MGQCNATIELAVAASECETLEMGNAHNSPTPHTVVPGPEPNRGRRDRRPAVVQAILPDVDRALLESVSAHGRIGDPRHASEVEDDDTDDNVTIDPFVYDRERMLCIPDEATTPRTHRDLSIGHLVTGVDRR